MIVIGEMGIGNTTPASVLTAKICGLSAQKAAGPGTGVTSSALKNKRRIIAHILKKVKNINCPYELLSIAGGLEIAQMAGAVLAAAEKKKIVVIDGLISTAAALIAFLINKESANFMFAGHKSTEPAHAAALKKLGLKPLLDLNMRLGEGTGAALAVCVIEASLKIMNEMATFDNAGVSKNL